MIYVFEHHDHLLKLWRDQGLTGVRLLHIDFHDDLRGLLIDRKRRCAYAIRDLAEATTLDEGNFLAHAVLEQRVREIRWVHDIPGGRAWDWGIVRYESDLFAWPARRRHRRRGGAEVDLEFEELTLRDWTGSLEGERLSVDWDCFASVLLAPERIDERAGIFLDRLRDGIPQDTYLVYSPEYCHPSLDGFRQFAETLQQRFSQPLRWIDGDLERGLTNPRTANPVPAGDVVTRVTLMLRRFGLY